MVSKVAVRPGQRCVEAGAATPNFLRAAVRNPQRIGAIAPSSARLAALLASVVPTEGEPVVVELGPGTGAVSTAIAAVLPRQAQHLAVELDPGMAAFLRRRHPDLDVIDGDAHALGELLAARDISRVAAVVSGLPWSLFDSGSHQRILQQVAEAIGADGVFTTFAYAHTKRFSGARGFRRSLEQTFTDVHISRIVWRNMPPAFAYVCREPRLPAISANP
jgi:phosphatidylethanolamine/phosphatidyl-N-methylethanolamine N-methyltransferase